MAERDDASRPQAAVRRSAVVRHAMRNPRLRRVLIAFLIFDIGEWATYIALLVWAYNEGGVRWASALGLAQLIPSALFASPAASLLDRLPRARALAVGYTAQTVAYLAVGAALLLDAPLPVVVVTSALAAVAVTMTRPVHNSFLPEISETTGELTAGNAATGSVEAIGAFLGPLTSGILVAVWDPGGVLVVMSALSLVAVGLTISMPVVARVAPHPSHVCDPVPPVRALLRDPSARLLTLLVGAEKALEGLMDILLVVLALDLLAMSDSGPGVLNSALGVGAIAGACFTFVLIGRQRLAPALLLGALGSGLMFALAGLATSAWVAVALVAVCGASKLFFDVATRTIIQRLLPDRLLTAMFGIQESMTMAGLAFGTLMAPVLVSLVGTRGAFLAAGLFLPVVALLTYGTLRRLDSEATVPADVLALLLKVPIFAVLAPRIVERMAREATRERVAAGAVVVTEGQPGQHFYVIESGHTEVTRSGEHIRDLSDGDWFGEIALLRDVPRTATVTAVDDVVAWSINRDSFLASVAGVESSVDAATAHARDHYR